AALCGGALLASIAVGAFLAPTMFGFWFPARHILAGLVFATPLIGWALRRLPRLGTVLGLVGVAASAWVWVYVRWEGGGLVGPLPDAPWGPLVGAFPLFADAAWPYVLAGALGVALAAAIGWELARERRSRAA